MNLRTVGPAPLIAAVVALLGATCGPSDPATPPGPPAPLGPNDVSVLFPLPARAEELGLLPMPTDSGARGVLLPREVYDRLPLLLTFAGPGETYSALRAVGVRLDPCFPGFGPAGPLPCRAQLRLVFQPMGSAFDGAHAVAADDAALHAFYELSADEALDVARTLARLRGASGVTAAGERLDAHPVIRAQGLTGAYAAGVRAIVRAHAGAQNLSRVTFMTLARVSTAWRFGGFDVGPQGALTPIAIAGLGGATEQAFTTHDDTGTRFDQAAASPATSAPDDASLLYDSARALAASPDAQRAAYGAALRIQNPERYSPETIDCVSCHTAEPVRAWAERTLGFTPAGDPAEYPAGEAAAAPNVAATPANSLRAFGYLGWQVAVSRRAANESAAVAARLDAQLGLQ